MAIHHQPVMLCLRDISNKSIMLSKQSHQGVCVCVCVWGGGGGSGGGGFYYTTKAASLIKGVIFFCWDIRGNYATKSTFAECVKRICLGCVDELLAAFLEFPGIDGEAG